MSRYTDFIQIWQAKREYIEISIFFTIIINDNKAQDYFKIFRMLLKIIHIFSYLLTSDLHSLHVVEITLKLLEHLHFICCNCKKSVFSCPNDRPILQFYFLDSPGLCTYIVISNVLHASTCWPRY